MKYKIVKTEGCTTFCTTVNGKNVNDLSPSEKDEFLDYLFGEIKTRILENNVSIDSLIEVIPYDSYETSKYACDQCGDTVSTTEWEI